MCNIYFCAWILGTGNIGLSHQKYSSDTSLLSVQEIDDVITFRGRSKQVKTDNRVVCFHQAEMSRMSLVERDE